MQETTLEDIRAIALRLHDEQSPWHFHILTPGCALNTSTDCVFVLEDVAREKVYAHHSDRPEKELGQELLPLLHGKKVLQADESAGPHEPSEAVKEMVRRATEMNAADEPWHHHVLFPACTFNEKPGRWTLMLEDTANNRVLESQSDEEPKKDLQLIEPLFYAKEN